MLSKNLFLGLLQLLVLYSSITSSLPGNVFSGNHYPKLTILSPDADTVWQCGTTVDIQFMISGYEQPTIMGIQQTRNPVKSQLYLWTKDRRKQRLISQDNLEDLIPLPEEGEAEVIGKVQWVIPTYLHTGEYFIEQVLRYWEPVFDEVEDSMKPQVDTESMLFKIECERPESHLKNWMNHILKPDTEQPKS
ncbi:hypothetical protein BKA69DRAFT_1123340 [Paraphysoderma sedebokerense]|nr:hypothetical protein BKA69DRAFT_1123340 [Paraphysoderma sedebokerense]